MRTALAAAAVALATTLTACGTTTEAPASADIAEAPPQADGPDGAEGEAVDLDFTSETVGGESFAGQSLEGRPTVLWFWAPWCPTCRAQISGVSELAERFDGEVSVVGVGAQDDPPAIADFAENVSDDVTVLSDADGSVWRHFGVTAQSTYLVLDESGQEQASGYLDDDELVDVVEQMVGG